jgi:uncharacterized protein YkwD
VSSPSTAALPALLLALVIALAPATPALAEGDADSEPCADAGSGFAAGSLVRVRSQSECLVNRERVLREIPPLRTSPLLEDSAQAHGRDMLERDYFSHTAPDGGTPAGRIGRTGYLRGARSWLIGENLAWLSMRPYPARATVRMWMDSRAHRAVMLDPRFREMGIAVLSGAPTYRRAALTLVLNLGRRW